MKTVDTNERTIGLYYSSISGFIHLSSQIRTRSSILFVAIIIRDLMSLLQLLSADFREPTVCEKFNLIKLFNVGPRPYLPNFQKFCVFHI